MADPVLESDIEDARKKADPGPAGVTDKMRPTLSVPLPPPSSGATDARRPSVTTPRNDGKRPGQAMRERAIHAPVDGPISQGLMVTGEKLRAGSEALDTHMGKISAAVANTFSPIDVAETAKLGSNAVQIAALANARNDSGRQAAFHDAQARNAAAMDQMSLDVQANKMVHGDPATMKEAEQRRLEHVSATHEKKQQVAATIKAAEDSGAPMTVAQKRALAESSFSAPTKEMETEARAHMLNRKLGNLIRKKKAAGASDAEVATLGTGGMVAGSAARAVAANLRLGAKGAAVGADSIDEWEMKHTVGEEVTGDLAQSGHVISESDRPESSVKGDINRVARSVANKLPGFDSDGRPLFNSTKLSDKEKGLVQDLNSKIGDLDERGKQSLKDRKGMEKGYTPEELSRRQELKSQISGLESKGAQYRKDNNSLGAQIMGLTGLDFSDQSKLDDHSSHVDRFMKKAESNQNDAVSAHQAEIDKLDAAAKANLGARRSKFLSKSHSDYHFTDEEKTEHEGVLKQIKQIKKAAKGRDLSDSEQAQIKALEARSADMKAFRDTGMTRDQRQERERRTSAIAGIKADATYGLSDEDHVKLAHHKREIADLEETRKTGLTKTERKQLADARAEREEQKRTRETGLTTSERQIKQHLEDSRTAVYEGAAEDKDLIDRNLGKTVRKVGDKHYVGGLNSTDNVTDEEMEATIGGRTAQGARTFGNAVHFAGEVAEGSADTAQKYTDNNELAKAAAITAGGAIKQGVSTAGSVTVPVLGGVAIKAGLEGGGKVLQGFGSVISNVADSAAQAQDQRDRQKDLTTGQRALDVRQHAINFTGSNAPEEKSLGSKLVDSASTLVSGAGSILMGSDAGKDLKKDAVGMLPDHVADKLGLNEPEEDDGPKELTAENLQAATQDAVKGEVQDTAKGMAMATGTDLVTKALAGHREDAPNARALKAFNREHHKKKKAEENRAAGLARQSAVRQQRDAARAADRGPADPDGKAMQAMFAKPLEKQEKADADRQAGLARQGAVRQQRDAARSANERAAGPERKSMKSLFRQRVPWWKRLVNAVRSGAKSVGRGVASIGRSIRRGMSSVGSWVRGLFG